MRSGCTFVFEDELFSEVHALHIVGNPSATGAPGGRYPGGRSGWKNPLFVGRRLDVLRFPRWPVKKRPRRIADEVT